MNNTGLIVLFFIILFLFGVLGWIIFDMSVGCYVIGREDQYNGTPEWLSLGDC